MAFIDIITNNQSRQNRNTVTYEDNWVYVPGNTITGDDSKPYLITSLDDFKSQFGSYSPDNSITFEYVSGILNAGLPVLFRRIISPEPDSTSAGRTLLVTKASYSITKTINDEAVTMVTFTEKYGGSFGNKLFILIRKTATNYYLDVLLNNTTTIESTKLMSVVASETATATKTRMIAALKSFSSDRIIVSNVNEDVSVFDIDAYIYGTSAYVSTNVIQLSGGTDIQSSGLANLYTGIAASYTTIKDKLLFNPKYLTTGGFCSEETSTKSVMIDAMMNLSENRQDCLALVDIAIGQGNGQDYQEALAKYGYTQTSDTQALPNALTCGPWFYTLVNGDYMWMPGSFAYLRVVGRDLSVGGKTYTPKAGIQNGRLNYVTKTEFDIGSDLIEEWQDDGVVNINPIVRMQGGNYIIAGNSTLLIKEEDEENLYSEASATMAIIEIKRLAYNTATEYQYLYNSVEAFENFSLAMANKLEAMKTEGAIYKYDIINNSSNSEPRKLKILLNVWLTPTIRNIEIYLNVAYGDIEVTSEGGNN